MRKAKYFDTSLNILTIFLFFSALSYPKECWMTKIFFKSKSLSGKKKTIVQYEYINIF